MKTAVDPELQRDVERLVHREHHDPHSLLGAHAGKDGTVVRAYRPSAEKVVARADTGETVELDKIHPAGLFEGTFEGAGEAPGYELEITYADGGTFTIRDPYSFPPTLGEVDLHLIGEGRHEDLYGKLGAHVTEVDGVEGTAFAVWAPAARSVSVVGAFNDWRGDLDQMRSLGGSGVWEIFIPGVAEGTPYKFEILTPSGEMRLKADPVAFATTLPPQTDSVVHRSPHEWADDEWMERRRETEPSAGPVSIYEVHLGSWRRVAEDGEERPLTYRELADELAAYVTDMGFTHVELMPVMEHPFGGSWGYQVTSQFAPTSRYGSPDDFRAFVDKLHAAGIGVILDWVPAHFPRDDWALARFDGTALYEHADPRRGAHPEWGTLIYNYGRHEVRNFLTASALFWPREYHADGIRVDAVASMLYLDYSRPEGAWVPNEFGGNEDLEAVEFLKGMNETLYRREPGIVSAAEESTAWPGVSRPTYLGGLGFGFKWNMGWMHDTLGYFGYDPIYRSLPPPRADLQPHLRLLGELHPAAVPRRGRPRQGLDAGEDGRRPLAEAGQPARALRLHVGAPGEEAPLHGQRDRPGGGVELRALARLAPAGAGRARRDPEPGAGPERAAARGAGAVRARLRRRRLLLAGGQRRGPQRGRLRPDLQGRRADAGLRRQPLAGPAAGLPGRAAARRAAGPRC